MNKRLERTISTDVGKKYKRRMQNRPVNAA
jgi:hypothetical protein